MVGIDRFFDNLSFFCNDCMVLVEQSFFLETWK